MPTTLDLTVEKCAMQRVKVATEQQVSVILDVDLGGEISIVIKVFFINVHVQIKLTRNCLNRRILFFSL